MPALQEDPQRIPCEVCEQVAGYYQLTDVVVDTVHGTPVWKPLPVSIFGGEIFSGYLILNTFSELVVYRSGEVFNTQEFTTTPFAYTEFYNYWIVNDSVMTVGPEHEPGSFFPHLSMPAGKVDTIIWDRCRYVRE